MGDRLQLGLVVEVVEALHAGRHLRLVAGEEDRDVGEGAGGRQGDAGQGGGRGGGGRAGWAAGATGGRWACGAGRAGTDARRRKPAISLSGTPAARRSR